MFLKNVQGVHDGPDFESHSGVGGEVGQLFHLPLVQPHIGHIGIWMMTIGEWEHFGIFLQLRNPPYMFCQNGMETIFLKTKIPNSNVVLIVMQTLMAMVMCMVIMAMYKI